MILVTGATGSLGKATLESLLKKVPAKNLAVLVRDPAKAAGLLSKGVTVHKGDYNDYSSLLKAFAGVDKLYFVSGNDLHNRTAQHLRVIRAAKEAGVGHIVYTSFARKNETDSSPIALVAASHIATEKALKESGIPYTILKQTIYMDMLPIFMGKVTDTGTIFLPAGEGRAGYTARRDMAEAGANILTEEGHLDKVYEISNTITYSYSDIAALLSEITGKKITYANPSRTVYEEELKKAGVPAEYIGLFAGFSTAIKENEFDLADTTLEKLLGRKPLTLDKFLRETYSPVTSLENSVSGA